MTTKEEGLAETLVFQEFSSSEWFANKCYQDIEINSIDADIELRSRILEFDIKLYRED